VASKTPKKDYESAKQKIADEYKGKSMKPGGGGRFKKMVDDLMKRGKSRKQAEAIAANAGRKKYGAEKFNKMAASGQSRKA
tara:strand:- start:22 stop:264 length:243 start_codon:yes stop_codon:yes gene_type:complete